MPYTRDSGQVSQYRAIGNMCIALFAISSVEDYPLVVLSNRDEFFSRPTSPAHFWEDFPHILGGRDEVHGGSWMGLTTRGRFCLVTNVRDPSRSQDKRSRGELVKVFLTEEMSAEEFFLFLKGQGEAFNPFNMVFGNGGRLYYFSNYYNELIRLERGIYVLSNGHLFAQWPKCIRLRELFLETVGGEGWEVEDLFAILRDSTSFPIYMLPDTGVGHVLEKFLSPIFIEGRDYGTRTSSVVIYERERIRFFERTYNNLAQVVCERDFCIFL